MAASSVSGEDSASVEERVGARSWDILGSSMPLGSSVGTDRLALVSFVGDLGGSSLVVVLSLVVDFSPAPVAALLLAFLSCAT